MMRHFHAGFFAMVILSTALVTGCRPSGDKAAPQQSAADKAKMDAASREANNKVRRAQIEQSNLPAAEKQRLLSQLDTTGGK